MFKRHHLRVRLESSDLYDEHGFYPAFQMDLRGARKRVLIESPFLTIRRTQLLLNDFKRLTDKGIEIRVQTRLPEHQSTRMEGEARASIQMLRSVNVRVFICSDMRHRKLAIIDETILWEGSLNILSQSNSCELMRRTFSERQCHDVIKLTRLKKLNG